MIFEFGKRGKTTERPRTADEMWEDLREAKMYMKIDSSLCLQYLKAFVAHTGEPAHCISMDGKGPVVIAAPSLEALLEAAKALQNPDRQHDQQGTLEEARHAYEAYKRAETEFFHTVFRPS
jgi:hypothetical protein